MGNEAVAEKKPNDAVKIQIPRRSLGGLSKLLLAVGGILSAGGGSYAAHAFGDKTGAAEVDALKKQFDEHVQAEQREKEQTSTQLHDLEKEISAQRLEYSTQLAGVHQSLQDMNETLRSISATLQLRSEQPQFATHRYAAPRRTVGDDP